MDQTDPALHDLVLAGIRVAQAKRKAEACRLLGEVVRRDSPNEAGLVVVCGRRAHAARVARRVRPRAGH